MKITVKKCREMTLEQFLEFTGGRLELRERQDDNYEATISGVWKLVCKHGNCWDEEPAGLGDLPEDAIDNLIDDLNSGHALLTEKRARWWKVRRYLPTIRVVSGAMEIAQ